MDPFEEGFTKVATRRELSAGEPRVFRASGAMVLVRQDANGQVEAIDGSCFRNDLSMPSAARLEQILDCIAAETGAPSSEWDELTARAGLPVHVMGDDVWICLEQCRS